MAMVWRRIRQRPALRACGLASCHQQARFGHRRLRFGVWHLHFQRQSLLGLIAVVGHPDRSFRSFCTHFVLLSSCHGGTWERPAPRLAGWSRLGGGVGRCGLCGAGWRGSRGSGPIHRLRQIFIRQGQLGQFGPHVVTAQNAHRFEDDLIFGVLTPTEN